MKNRRSKPIVLAIAIFLGLATLVSGATFAWFTARDQVTNKLESGQIGVSLIEVWDPDDGLKWEPGLQLNKIVSVVNTGSVDSVVRVTFDEAIRKIIPDAEDETGMPKLDLATAKYAGGTPVSAGAEDAAEKLPKLFNFPVTGWDNFKTDVTDSTKFAVGSAVTYAAGISAADVEIRYKRTQADPVHYQHQFIAFAEVTAADDKYTGMKQRVRIEYTIEKENEVQIPKVNIHVLGFEEMRYDALKTFSWDEVKPARTMPPLKVNAHADDKLQLIMGAYVKSDVNALAQGDWFYNAADGWFYYIGRLSPGTMTTKKVGTNIESSPLLTALLMDHTANNAYSEIRFDLTPRMEAVQNLGEAFRTWWKAPAEPPAKLIEAMKTAGALAVDGTIN